MFVHITFHICDTVQSFLNMIFHDVYHIILLYTAPLIFLVL